MCKNGHLQRRETQPSAGVLGFKSLILQVIVLLSSAWMVQMMHCLPHRSSKQQWQMGELRWTHGMWCMVTAITWLRKGDHTVCETNAEGWHLKPCRLCGITQGIQWNWKKMPR